MNVVNIKFKEEQMLANLKKEYEVDLALQNNIKKAMLI